VPKAALAAEIWAAMFRFVASTGAGREHILRDQGLTPGDFKALLTLSQDEPRPMGVLAQSWACDASNVTWVVDRLEERGLVERRAQVGDRRVKAVILTPLGAKTRAELLARFATPPDDLLELDRADLEAMSAALAKLPRRSSPFDEFL
jgi:DNA-binding MarR family transcriptional regulator